jgi:hypothetical protein
MEQETHSMIKKLSMVAAVVALATMAFAAFAPAVAAEEPKDERRHNGTVLRGEGTLDARGSGLIALKGRIDALEVSAERGILLVKDIAGDADVAVEGDGGAGEFHGFDVYFGAGSATISGSEVAVIVLGKGINLHAEGEGWAYLKGHGVFHVNERGPFRWNAGGGFAVVEPEEDSEPGGE